jgi:hypothetical protein
MHWRIDLWLFMTVIILVVCPMRHVRRSFCCSYCCRSNPSSSRSTPMTLCTSTAAPDSSRRQRERSVLSVSFCLFFDVLVTFPGCLGDRCHAQEQGQGGKHGWQAICTHLDRHSAPRDSQYMQLRKKIVQELDQRQELKVRMRAKQEEAKRRKTGATCIMSCRGLMLLCLMLCINRVSRACRAGCTGPPRPGPLQVCRARPRCIDIVVVWLCASFLSFFVNQARPLMPRSTPSH